MSMLARHQSIADPIKSQEIGNDHEFKHSCAELQSAEDRMYGGPLSPQFSLATPLCGSPPEG
jgi:hypothetical protein